MLQIKSNRYSLSTRQPLRNQQGSLLLVIALLMVLLAVIGFMMAIGFVQQTQMNSKNSAERCALDGTTTLNQGDRIGRMNNMIYASRELVFDSSQNYFETDRTARQFGPLAKQLLDEAAEGAALVNEEQDAVIKQSLDDLRQVVGRTSNPAGLSQLQLPFFQSDAPVIQDFSLGRVSENTDSNVPEPSSDGNPELLDLDMRTRAIDPKTHRYYGNQELTLPGDCSLKFKLSCLAASSDSSLRPASLIQPQHFKNMFNLVDHGKEQNVKCTYLPSAVLVRLTTKVKSSSGQPATLLVESASTTSNALPPSWREVQVKR